MVKSLPAVQETPGLIPGREDSPEEESSSILAWSIPWIEEAGRLQSMGVAKSWTWLSIWDVCSSLSLPSFGGTRSSGKVRGKQKHQVKKKRPRNPHPFSLTPGASWVGEGRNCHSQWRSELSSPYTGVDLLITKWSPSFCGKVTGWLFCR